MTTYYADFDLTTGSNDGSDATNAWQSMADIISGAPSDGDTVLCKGTDTLSAACSWTISGSSSGYIKLIGVDDSWDNVGGDARAVLDRDGGASSCLSIAGSYCWFENFEVTGAGASGSNYHGIEAPSGGYRDYNVFVNCYSHDNYGEGFNGTGGYGRYASFYKCLAENNAVGGYADWKDTGFYLCRSSNNSGRGVYPRSGCTCYGCISHDNGGEGVYNYYGVPLINCALHDNGGDGVEYPTNPAQSPIGLRSTANAVGIRCGGTVRMPLFYYYGDNTTETIGNFDEVLNDGNDTVALGGSDTDYGYEDSANDDYRLASDAAFFNEKVEIP